MEDIVDMINGEIKTVETKPITLEEAIKILEKKD